MKVEKCADINKNVSQKEWGFRSKFIQLIIYFSFLLSLTSLDAQSDPQAFQRYEFSEVHMGTLFRIVIYAESEIIAQKASSKAFHKIEELNVVFSDYLETSELSLISKNAYHQKVKVSKDMWYLLKLSDSLYNLSDGAFNIALGPLTKLWRRAIRRQELPEEKLIQKALDKSNWRDVILDPKDKSIRLKKEGMRLDMGGIAKGFAVDQAYKILLTEGLAISLVDGGGDIYAGEAPPEKKGWKINIESNSKLGNQEVILKNEAIASSGSIFKFVEHENQRYSHIINPITGYGISDPRNVTVRSKNCVEADACATTFSILSNPKIVERISAQYQSTTL